MRRVSKPDENTILAVLGALVAYVLLLITAPHPLNLVLAPLIAALVTGYLAPTPLKSAVAAGFSGLAGFILGLVYSRVPGVLAGYAEILGGQVLGLSLLYHTLLTSSLGVLLWHGWRINKYVSSQAER